MGRPRKAEPREHQVNLSFSAPEIVRIHRHAALTGKTVAEFGRAVLLKRPRKRKRPDAPRLMAFTEPELARWQETGTRLNQVAHRMNLREEMPPARLARILVDVRRLLRRNFPSGSLDQAYTLAPAVRFHLRKVGTNLVQIRISVDGLGFSPPIGLVRLLAEVRRIMAGDQLPHDT